MNPSDPGVSILQAGDFHRFAGHGIGQQHDSIALRNLFLGITIIKCLDPDDSINAGRRLPLMRSRPGDHAADGHLIAQRFMNQLMHIAGLKVANFNDRRERSHRHLIRIRPNDARHEQVTAGRRRGRHPVDGRLADEFAFSAFQINDRQLRCEVIVHQRFIMRIAQQILVRSHRRCAPTGLLDHGTGRNRRTLRRLGAIGREEVNEKLLAVGHPRKGAENPVHLAAE